MNKTLIFTLVGAGALLLLSKKGGNGSNCSSSDPAFNVPNKYLGGGSGTTAVCQSQLPSKGFVKYQGGWYHQTQFEPDPSLNLPSDSVGWLNMLTNLIGQGTDIVQSFMPVLRVVNIDYPNQKASVQVKFADVDGTISVTPNTNSQPSNRVKVVSEPAQGSMPAYTSIEFLKADGTTKREGIINWTYSTATGFD